MTTGTFTGTDRYELLRKLGQGGMGAVYAVFDKRRQRKVALKVLSDPHGGSLFRFKREFRTMADLRHPNLVRLFDLGVLPQGGFFFTMELIEGADLGHWKGAAAQPVGVTVNAVAETVDEKTWTPTPGGEETVSLPGGNGAGPTCGELVSVLTDVTAGLRCLHESRKVHRDLKPSNVIVDERGRARLLDFGILHELDAGGGLTGQAALGTPLYMAPEQVAGTAVTPAADVYSLGCMLYKLLCGEPPFKGAVNRVLMQHLREAPRPPSEVRPCDADLERLCLELLAKAPEDRPSVDAVLARLTELGGEAPEVATGDHSARAQTEVVGRDAELARLQATYADAQSGPRIVLISGETGVGKSTLAHEFALQADVAPFVGACYEREHVPYKAFDAIMDAAVVGLARRGKDAGALLPPGSHALARLFPVLREVSALDDLPPETSLHDPMAERDRAGRAYFQILTNLCGRAPLLVIDDLQRADSESFDVLRWLDTLERDPFPCMIVATYRDEELAPGSPLEDLVTNGRRTQRLHLEPLPREAAEQLARAHASQTLSETQLARLVEDAGGNPFLAVELAQASRELSGDAMPTVSELVERRLAGLDDGVRAVLEAAAVAGGRASFPLLQRASKLEPGVLADALDELLRSQLLREVQGSGSEDAYDLAHGRLRAAVYERVEPERRRTLHQDLADELGARGDAARAVEHWRAGGEPEQARQAALTAAREAEEKLAFDQAAALYALASQDAADWSLRFQHAEALRKAGRHGEAAAVYEAAAADAPPDRQRDLALTAATEQLAAGDVAAGMQGLDRLLRGLGSRISRSAVVMFIAISLRMTWLMVAWFVWDMVGRFVSRKGEGRQPTPEEAYELRVLDAAHHYLSMHRPLISAYHGVKHSILSRRFGDQVHQGRARIGYALFLAGEVGGLFRRRAFHHLTIGEGLCSQAGDTQGLLLGQFVRAFLALIMSNFEGLRRASQNATQLARKHGFYGHPTLMAIESMHVASELFAGDLPALIKSSEGYLRGARIRGNVWGLAWPLSLQGYTLLFMGEEERGRAALEEALAVTPAEPLTVVRIHVELFAMALYLVDEKPDEGLAALEDLNRRWRCAGLVASSMENSTYRLMKARLILLQARMGTTRRRCRLGLALRRMLPATSSMKEEMLRLEAAAAMQNGNLRCALDHLSDALYLAEGRNNRFGIGMLSVARARVRERLDLPGAELDRERGRAELAAIGAADCYLLRAEGWTDPLPEGCVICPATGKLLRGKEPKPGQSSSQ